MFTIACADVDSDRSVQMTFGPACGTVRRYSTKALRTSSLRGILLPDLPLLAESWRQMVRPISPWESLVIHQVSLAISLALRPVLADRRKMSRFLVGCRVVER